MYGGGYGDDDSVNLVPSPPASSRDGERSYRPSRAASTAGMGQGGPEPAFSTPAAELASLQVPSPPSLSQDGERSYPLPPGVALAGGGSYEPSAFAPPLPDAASMQAATSFQFSPFTMLVRQMDNHGPQQQQAQASRPSRPQSDQIEDHAAQYRYGGAEDQPLPEPYYDDMDEAPPSYYSRPAGNMPRSRASEPGTPSSATTEEWPSFGRGLGPGDEGLPGEHWSDAGPAMVPMLPASEPSPRPSPRAAAAPVPVALAAAAAAGGLMPAPAPAQEPEFLPPLGTSIASGRLGYREQFAPVEERSEEDLDWNVEGGEGIRAQGPLEELLPPVMPPAHPSAPAPPKPMQRVASLEPQKEGFRKMLYDCTVCYTRRVPSKRPALCGCCGFILVLVIVGLGMVLFPMEVETDFSSFMKTDVKSSKVRDGFEAALNARYENGRRLYQILYKDFHIYVAYELKPGFKLFDKAVVTQMAAFERRLTGLAGWGEFCNLPEVVERQFCELGVSLANYAKPSLDIVDGAITPTALTLDGEGDDPVPLETTLTMLRQHDVMGLVFPKAIDPQAPEEATSVRSMFRFKLRCCTSLDSMSFQRQQVQKFREAFEKFVEESALPVLQEASEDTALPFRIFYDGDGFEAMEVMQTLMSDVALAYGSMAFVLFYVVLHTRSIFLSIMGLLLVLLAVPLSYVLFAVLSGTTTMSIASFLSLFLVIGLGSDVIFVYTDFWRDSERRMDSEADRLVWTSYYAGKASLATTSTTALSFFANLASVLRPLREFGMFMGLCVMMVWVLISFVFLPLCAIDDRMCGRCRLRCRDGSSSHTASREKEVISTRLLGSWEEVLMRWRRSVLILAALFGIMSLALSALFVETDTGLPDIFPADHNQNRGKEVLEDFLKAEDAFSVLRPVPTSKAEVCKEWVFRDQDRDRCSLFWCEADETVGWSEFYEVDGCNCYREELSSAVCGNSRLAYTTQRIIGPEGFAQDAVTNYIRSNLDPSITDYVFSGSWELAPMIQLAWETGDVSYTTVHQAEGYGIRNNNMSSCGFQELCFCGTHNCKLPGSFVRVDDPLMIPRSLQVVDDVAVGLIPPQEWRVPSTLRADVAVVLGIKIEEDTPLLGELEPEDSWAYLESFQMHQPWTQRKMVALCDAPPLELRVAGAFCWIKDFRGWLKARGERFPVTAERFHGLATSFSQTGLTGTASSKDYMWIDGGEVKATFLSFVVDFNKDASAVDALRFKEGWDKLMSEWNTKAWQPWAGAWHTSRLWVRAEAQNELIKSTALTLGIVLGLAFVGMLLFTHDCCLSLLVVLSTAGVVCGLAFFIIIVMGWSIGPIEVIALIVFTGYAVTYSLHVAHKYGDSEALVSDEPGISIADRRMATRYQRTGYALKSIGTAAMGSAITTCGSSVFLIACTLTIFQKLGGVVLAVTLMSILTALGPLPAALLICGPVKHGCACLGKSDEPVRGDSADLPHTPSPAPSPRDRPHASHGHSRDRQHQAGAHRGGPPLAGGAVPVVRASRGVEQSPRPPPAKGSNGAAGARGPWAQAGHTVDHGGIHLDLASDEEVGQQDLTLDVGAEAARQPITHAKGRKPGDRGDGWYGRGNPRAPAQRE